MATVTLTLTDKGDSYEITSNVDDSLVAERQVTAAHFAGFYLYNHISTEEFRDSAWRQALAVAKDRGATGQGKVMIELIDTDIESGEYTTSLRTEGLDVEAKEESPALLAGNALYAYIRTEGFAKEVWEFAEQYVANNASAKIANNDNNPDHPHPRKRAAN